ncbi:MAG: 50S ribosomal protein L15 [Chitinispirillia bacterium]|jgi:large subunit ribosomal protein L15
MLNNLSPAKGSKRNKKRIGKGPGSGWGTTSGKGSNGAKARRGAKNKLYFEGGQTPLTRRLPKRGFNNIFRTRYQIVNIGDVQMIEIEDSEIDAQWLFNHGLIHSKDKLVKILGNGEISKNITIKANAFSKTARDKIEKAKGKIEVVKGV